MIEEPTSIIAMFAIRNAGQRAYHDRELLWQALAEQDHTGKAKAAR
jgi:hypothetical protein